ncbi:MAG: hypothetical protein HQ567_04955 [Candidatus Nealsonbacteria bacterium]|nr:hypothetical protein [Candidatus Nealsonbacteria bacterium]
MPDSREEVYPSAEFLVEVADAAEKLGATLRKNYPFMGASLRENPAQALWPAGNVSDEDPDVVKQLLRHATNMVDAMENLDKLLATVHPADQLAGLENVDELRKAHPGPPETENTVRGWQFEVSQALRTLRRISDIVHMAPEPNRQGDWDTIDIRELEKLKVVAEMLREAADGSTSALCVKEATEHSNNDSGARVPPSGGEMLGATPPPLYTPALVLHDKPVPDWLPQGWESSSYPAFGDTAAIRQWIAHVARGWERITPDCLEAVAKQGGPPFVVGEPIPVYPQIRDAYRLVTHLVNSKQWKSPPKKPTSEFTDYPIAAAEMQRILAWIDVCLEKPNRRGAKARKVATPEKRSWMQPELDLAIEGYKAERASNYNELARRVQAGDKGARKAAGKMFGRNVIAEALGVKSRTMVGKSPVWQGIADALDLPRKRGPSVTPATTKIGLDIASEKLAVAKGNPVEAEAIRNETLRALRRAINEVATKDKAAIQAILEKYQDGDMTDDQALGAARLYHS